VNASWNVMNFRAGLIRGLQEAGHQVAVLAPLDKHSDQVRDLGVIYEPIDIDRSGISPVRDFRLFWQYRKLLRRLNPDIYLGFTVKPNVYGSLAAHTLGIRVINNVAGLGVVFVKRTMLTRIVSLLYRLAFRRSDTVFFQNDDDLSLFVSDGLVKASQARLLPGSGVDLARFAPAPPRPAGSEFTFLLIARLLWDKGIGEYVEAARALRSENPRLRFQLLGFIDPSSRNAVPRATVESWVKEGIVEYLGEAEDVRPHVRAADCIVLPTRYREGVPRSLIEAAAMAKPLITTDTPGCRDIVRHGENGLLCGGDSASLVAAMRDMLACPEDRRREMGRAGRALVEGSFSEEIVVGRYLEAIAAARIG
jgi:glycosyltransferase involved in cell wall biosynthesis